MTPAIAIGTQNYEIIRQNKYFFVDKTSFIREWWENGDAVTLITRPRRFGKSLNLSMLECFFSNKYSGRCDLFDGLAIWEDQSYRTLQGSYPVIFLSFADIKGNTFKSAREAIKQIIIDLYTTFNFLLDSDRLNDKEKACFDYINEDMSDTIIAMSIKRLSLCLNRYYEKKVLIFLDEYDTPLQEAYIHGYWDKLTVFIRSLFNSTFKTNPYLERAMMTGITRVSKESIFSDMNNLAVITTTTERYATAFGFTEDEVFNAMDQYGMYDRKDEIKSWYDGFTFGTQRDIYNPWSITCFLKEKRLKTYWANTSSNSLINQLIREGSSQIKIIMEDLLEGRVLETEIDEEIIFDQLQTKRGAIWSLLLASGYLKVVSSDFNAQINRYVYQLALTNREVYLMFEDMIKDWFSNEGIPYNDFIKAMLQDDVDYMNDYMNQVAKHTFSTFDTGNKPSASSNPERFYHGFVLGLIVELAGEYQIRSNRESGFGRYDVMLEPIHPKHKAYILEFKVRNPRKEETLTDTLKSAHEQIETMDYDSELIARGILPNQIRHYGFAFEGKKVLIG